MSGSIALIQLSQFLEFLRGKPHFQKIIDYLSENVALESKACGVGLFFRVENGIIDTVYRKGIPDAFPLTLALPDSSNHPIASAYRNNEIQITDFNNIASHESDLLKEQIDFGFKAAVAGSVNTTLAIGFLFQIDFDQVVKNKPYYNSVISALRMYAAFQSKKFINPFEISRVLTSRQTSIYERILQGKSNKEIASELSFSVSLIRQETMRIYEKLGVDGRQDLKRLAPKTKRLASTNQV